MLAHVNKLEDDLIEVEMKLSESLTTATSEFEEKIKRIIEDIRSKTGAL